jgi:DMATS type aromatic prenyltransferase
MVTPASMSSTSRFEPRGHETLGGCGHAQLLALGEALGMKSDLPPALELFDVMSETWSERSIAAGPAFASDLTDDHSPFEFSLAFDGLRPQLRLLVEAVGSPASLGSNWEASKRLSERLEREFGAHFGRAREVQDLFQPITSGLRFASWHAACFRAGAPATFKVYYNPQAQGVGNAPALVREALAKLGFAPAWEWIAARALHGGRGHITYFALDLVDSTDARVKVYVAYPAATTSEVERLMAEAQEHRPGDARRFCTTLTRSEGPYRARPILLSLAFVASNVTRPNTITLHLPIRCYVDNDAIAMQRINSVLSRFDVPVYQRAVTSMAHRSLPDGVGLQTYASTQWSTAGQRVTVYLSPELYGVSPARRA